jgi:hypothetical protein
MQNMFINVDRLNLSFDRRTIPFARVNASQTVSCFTSATRRTPFHVIPSNDVSQRKFKDSGGLFASRTTLQLNEYAALSDGQTRVQ